jgi:transcriptional regulator with XRE-family HTH domain
MVNGALIREAREAAGLSQAGLADALSVSTLTVWRWEHGRTKRLDFGTAVRLASVLGVEPSELHAPPTTAPNGAPEDDTSPAPTAATR